jgi:hypothetical protein
MAAKLISPDLKPNGSRMADRKDLRQLKSMQREAAALVECLAYLEPIAHAGGFCLSAHFIALAREATHDAETSLEEKIRSLSHRTSSAQNAV